MVHKSTKLLIEILGCVRNRVIGHRYIHGKPGQAGQVGSSEETHDRNTSFSA